MQVDSSRPSTIDFTSTRKVSPFTNLQMGKPLLVQKLAVSHRYLSQVRREFKSLASSDFDPSTIVENWLEWRVKLIQLAQLESATRPLIRKLLRRIDEFDELQYPEGLFSCVYNFKNYNCLLQMPRILFAWNY